MAVGQVITDFKPIEEAQVITGFQPMEPEMPPVEYREGRPYLTIPYQPEPPPFKIDKFVSD